MIVEVAWDASPTVTITARFETQRNGTTAEIAEMSGVTDREVFDAYVRGWGEKDREAQA